MRRNLSNARFARIPLHCPALPTIRVHQFALYFSGFLLFLFTDRVIPSMVSKSRKPSKTSRQTDLRGSLLHYRRTERISAMARGRIPRPWFRAGSGQWFVTLDGKQIPLGKSKREAHAEFARLMAQRGRGPQASRRLTVSGMVDLWLAGCHVKPITLRCYSRLADQLTAWCGGLRCEDIRPHHIEAWCDSHRWGQATRHLAISIARMITAWADAQGYLDRDPLRALKRPTMPRRKPITQVDLTTVLDRLSPVHAVPLRFLALCGIRPGELVSMTIEGCDLETSQVHVIGKTGARSVALSTPAVELLRSIIGARESGPVWWGAKGKPLSRHALETAVRRARGDLRHVVPHGGRGLFATQALRAGVDSLMVSALLGHKDLTQLGKHYASPDADMLKAAAEKASKGRE